MLLRVGQDQRRTPGAAEEQPPLDAEVLAQPFHVGDQVPVVFTLMSVAGSLACGVLRPQPRWSKSTTR